MVPDNITKQHVLEAIANYNKNGIRFPLAKSKKFYLEYKNALYPPKYIICLANEFANGEYLSYQTLDTSEAQRYLKELSEEFSIRSIKSNNNPL